MDWADLNPDLLLLISQKLGDISNFIRFRAVCKSWRFALNNPKSDLPPQLPWFIESRPKIKGKSDRKFFSLYSNKTHTLNIEKGKDLYEPSSRDCFMHDYLGHPKSLLNSFVRTHFSVYELENFRVYPIYAGPYGNPNPNPVKNGDIAVVFENTDKFEYFPRSIDICRCVDRELTKIVEVIYAKSIAYSQGKLFVYVQNIKKTRVFDVINGNEVMIIASRIEFDFLVEACGDLLGLVKRYARAKLRFEVYRLENHGRDTDSHWVKMNGGIGDRVLFLDGHRLKGGFALKASDFEGFMANCIYFVMWSKRVLCRYDLGSKKTEILTEYKGFSGAWFVPRLC